MEISGNEVLITSGSTGIGFALADAFLKAGNQVVIWEVDPQHQQELIDSICDQIEQHIKSDIGFVSASLHASEDGRRVINYGQWRSKEDWSHLGRLAVTKPPRRSPS